MAAAIARGPQGCARRGAAGARPGRADPGAAHRAEHRQRARSCSRAGAMSRSPWRWRSRRGSLYLLRARACRAAARRGSPRRRRPASPRACRRSSGSSLLLLYPVARAGPRRPGGRHQVDRQFRHPDPDLHHAGLGPEHRRRPRRAARSRLRRLLRRRRLRLRAAGHQRPRQGLHGRVAGPNFWPLWASGSACRWPASWRPSGASCWASRCCGCAATISPSSRWRSARSSASCSSTGCPSPTAMPASPAFPRPTFFGLPFNASDTGLRRLLRPRVHAALPHHLPVLRDPGAGPAHQLGHPAPAPAARRPRLGGAARGRDRLPLARHQHHQHQAHRLRHRRRLRRLRRLVLRRAPGLHQPGVLHLHGERDRASPSSCWAAWAARSASPSPPSP